MADDLSVVNLRGGQNDTDAPTALADNQCVLAQNVEFYFSAVGERRCGCEPLMDMTGSGLENSIAIVHLSQWFPGNQITQPQLVAVGAVPAVSASVGVYSGGSWTILTPTDPIIPNAPDVYNVASQDLNGKDFFAYPSSVDRLHVYDGTTLRRTGLAMPAVITAADASGVPFFFGGAVTYSTTTQAPSTTSVNIGDTTGMSLIVVAIVATAGVSYSLFDTYGNKYTVRTSQPSGDSATLGLQTWDTQPVKTGANHYVSVKTASSSPLSLHVSKWGGAATSAYDQAASAAGGAFASSILAGAVTPSFTNELVLSYVAVSQGGAGAAPFGVNSGLAIVGGEISANPVLPIFGLAGAEIIETTIVGKNPTWSWAGIDSETAAVSLTYANVSPPGVAGLRYYRIRYLTITPTFQILLKSEPGPSLAYTPGGGALGVIVTRPVLLGEAETHWVLEGSLDNATFYTISAPIPVATTTWTDLIPTTTYSSYPQSEPVGTYLLQPAARYLAVEGDRLVMGGHFTDPTRQSRVSWTPVAGDPGFGNDERIPLTSNNFFDLDNYTGGGLTGIANCGYGVWYAFKFSRIYQLTRSGNVTNAYNLQTITTQQGAIPGSIISAYDDLGNPCIYFIEPNLGPCSISTFGLTVIKGLRATWSRANLNATNIVARVVNYSQKKQIHWWFAADGNSTPSLKIVLQTDYVSEFPDGGVGGGWSIATGRIAQAYAASIYTEPAFVNGTLTLSQRPVIGLTAPDFIQRCDVDDQDASIPYTALLVTKPYLRPSLLGKWDALAAEFLATTSPGNSVTVSCIRDFGKETSSVTGKLDPISTETQVIVTMDDLSMSEAKAMQFSMTDPSS